jgi:hypothetical protein
VAARLCCGFTLTPLATFIVERLRPICMMQLKHPTAMLFRLLAVIVVAVVALLSMTVPGSSQGLTDAQPPATADEPIIDPAALDRIISTLESEPARQRLVEELRALQAAQATVETPEDVGLAGHVLQALSSQVDAVGASLAEAARGFAGLPEFARHAMAQLADAPQRRAFFTQVAAVIAALLTGLVVYAVMVTVAAPRARRHRGSAGRSRHWPASGC